MFNFAEGEARIFLLFRVERSAEIGAVFTPVARAVYTPWYAGGTMHDHRRYSRRDCQTILLDAWSGLRELNRSLKIIHYDIKPDNLFVELLPDGSVRGVIGDVDHAVHYDECQNAVQTKSLVGTVCYGAPFRDCDDRRDQVALLLTTMGIMANKSWYEHCKQYFGGVPLRFGFWRDTELLFEQTSESLGVYASYATYVSIQPLSEILQSISQWEGVKEWKYDEKHTLIVDGLSSIRTKVNTAGVRPTWGGTSTSHRRGSRMS